MDYADSQWIENLLAFIIFIGKTSINYKNCMECFLRIHFDICKKSVSRKELFQISKVYKVSLCNSITIKSLSISVKSLTIINLKTGAEAVKKLLYTVQCDWSLSD